MWFAFFSQSLRKAETTILLLVVLGGWKLVVSNGTVRMPHRNRITISVRLWAWVLQLDTKRMLGSLLLLARGDNTTFLIGMKQKKIIAMWRHSGGMNAKLLNALLAFKSHPIWSLAYRDSCHATMQWSNPTYWTRPQRSLGPEAPLPSDYWSFKSSPNLFMKNNKSCG